MLCLCVLCALAAVGSSAATALPVTFSTTVNVYQYAVSKKDPDTVTYSASAAGSGTATALPGGGISVSLDTGYNQNFKLCYKEIPVTVTVPANTTYTVALKFALDGKYIRESKKAGAKASFQVVYLGDASAADKTTVFYPCTPSRDTIKTTIDGSDANTNILQQKMEKDSKTTTTVNLSETKSFDFVNTTSKTKDITKYFGVWIAGTFGKSYKNQATATCTVTPASYLVTFDPNDGKVSQKSTAVTINKPYGTLPTPNRTGYSFAGWYTEKTGGTKVESDTIVGKDPPTTLYAHWTANQYLVALDANGGKIDTTSGQVNKKNYTATYGSKYNFLPTPTRTGGYKFAGWYTEETGGTEITSDTTVTTAKTHILYAHWSLTPADAPKNVTLTMNPTTGVYGKQIFHQVSSDKPPGHTLKRTWYDCDKNGKNGILITDENGDPTYPTTPTAGVHYYYVVVTTTRKDNGQQASTKSNVVCVTVTKATPTITTKPTAATLDLTKGNTLAASALTGGIAKNNNANPSIPVAGHFAWKDATVKPSRNGGYYAVVFQPDDTKNYTTAETTVKVQVTCSHRFGAWSAGKRTCTVCGEKETRYNTVTVTWGALAYTYTDGTWNPATHAYDIGGGWKPNQTNGDAITVQNESADEVHVRFQYTQTNTAISGGFVNSEENGIYSAIELPVNQTQTVRLRLTGRPNTALNNTNIGSVTVRLER